MEGARKANFDMHDVIAVLTRLAQIMAEEADLLDAMQVKAIEPFQDEKKRLAKMLTVMKRELDKTPETITELPYEERESFFQALKIFDGVLQENYRKLMVAKEINATVVHAISDVVKENARQPVYTRGGSMKEAGESLPSITLNQKI